MTFSTIPQTTLIYPHTYPHNFRVFPPGFFRIFPVVDRQTFFSYTFPRPFLYPTTNNV